MMSMQGLWRRKGTEKGGPFQFFRKVSKRRKTGWSWSGRLSFRPEWTERLPHISIAAWLV